MPRANPSRKLAISVDPEVHQRLVRAAAEDGTSVSAWLTEVAHRALVIRDGLAGVAEWERVNGALTDEEMTVARHRVAREAAQHGRSAARRTTT